MSRLEMTTPPEIVRTLRRELGMSQGEIGALFGHSATTQRRYETTGGPSWYVPAVIGHAALMGRDFIQHLAAVAADPSDPDGPLCIFCGNTLPDASEAVATQ